MKVLLVHAKFQYEEISHRQIPLGISYIASFIEQRHEVKVFDEPVEDEKLSEVIHNFRPEVIGVSFTTQSAIRAYEIAKQYKDTAILVAGGVHATLHPQEALSNGFLIVSYGEGEISFLNLLDNLKNGNDFSNIVGIYYFSNGKLIKNKKATCKICLDDYPIPARHLLKMDKYDQESIVTSRGCPFNCKFCVSSIMREQNLRHRSAENVFYEIKQVVMQYNKTNIHFCDDTFTVDHGFVKRLCKLIINANLKFKWSILSRVDTINNDEEMLRLLKEAGCRLIIFGIESGSQKILNKIGKGISIAQIEESILLCRKVGIDIKTTWIIGLPGNYGEQMESLKLMKRINPNQITVHMFIPYPGTKLYEEREKYGIWIREKTFIQSLPYLNPGYFNERIINLDVFRLEYLTFKEIVLLAKHFTKELRKMGYIYPNEYNGIGEEKTFKTFLDKINNPLLKF